MAFLGGLQFSHVQRTIPRTQPQTLNRQVNEPTKVQRVIYAWSRRGTPFGERFVFWPKVQETGRFVATPSSHGGGLSLLAKNITNSSGDLERSIAR